VPLWLDLLLKNTPFRNIAGIQQDSHKDQMRYLKLAQELHAEELKISLTAMGQVGQGAAIWPPLTLAPGREAARLQIKSNVVVPLGDTWGPFDVLLYQGPLPMPLEVDLGALPLRPEGRAALIAAGHVAQGAKVLPRVFLMAPDPKSLVLTVPRAFHPTPTPPWWVPMFEDGMIEDERDRLGLPRRQGGPVTHTGELPPRLHPPPPVIQP